MSEKPKAEKEKEAEKSSDAICESGIESSTREHQREKSYYYDDAHGYEIYNPDEDEDDEDDE